MMRLIGHDRQGYGGKAKGRNRREGKFGCPFHDRLSCIDLR
jgi:hypothetical protein